MKKGLLLFQLFLILSGSVSLYAGDNLLQNGSFEDISDNLPKWWSTHIYGNDYDSVRFYVGHDQPHSGRNYITLENIKANDSKLIQSVKVKPNTIYKLSCWIRAEGIGQNALGANISVFDIVATSKDFKDTNGNWQYVEFYGRSSKDQSDIIVTARLGGYGNVNTGKASFDDFKLEEVEQRPEGIKVVDLFRKDAKPSAVNESSQEFARDSSFNSIILYSLLLLGLFFVICYFTTRANQIKSIEDKYTTGGFGLFLFAGFVLRILLAFFIEGHPTDILCFKAWANIAANKGLANFYTTDMFVDYPPGYIYILYVIGFIRNLFQLDMNSGIFFVLLKLPAISADIICSAIIFNLAKKRLCNLWSLVLSAFYIFNPAVFFNSAIYGQIDSILTVLVLAVLICAYEDRLKTASIIFVIAVLVKPQALVFLPVGIFALIQNKSLKTLGACLLIMAATFIVVITPFSLKQDLLWIFRLYAKTLSSYQYASVNAFNLFAFLGGNGVYDSEILFLFSYRIWAIVITSAIICYSAFVYFRSKDKSKIFFISMFILTGVFVFSCKMHERYIFPVIALSVISYIYTKDKRVLFLSVLLSVTAFLNQALLLKLIYEKELFWFASGDFFMRTIPLVNIAAFIYMIKVSIDIYIKNKSIASTPRANPENQSGIKDTHTRPIKLLSCPDSLTQLSGKDYLLINILILLYSLVALFNLGSFKAPQSFWKPASRGESFYVDLGESHDINKINYFFGLGQGSYKLEFSEDNQIWGNQKIIQQKTSFGSVGWNYLALNLKARYVKITCEQTGLMLNELGFFSFQSKEPIAVKSIQTTLSPGTALPSNGKPENVFDEQATAAYVPGFMSKMYFDEVYFARTAYEHLNGMEPTETTHPPLGKVIISLGIAVFGMTPFGWRIMGVIFGIAMIAVMYLFGMLVFKKTKYAFITSFLFTFDFMFFVQTRIGTADVFAVFFIILMYYFMYQYFSMNPFQTGLKKSFVPLLLSGVFFGLGAASKWTAFYGGLGLGVILLTSLGLRSYEFSKAKKNLTLKLSKTEREYARFVVKSFYRYAVLTSLCCILFFVVIPAVIYVLSYTPFLMLEGPGHGLSNVISYQKHMYQYHSQLTASHPFSSSWWQWPIIQKPVWAYAGVEDVPSDMVSSIVIMGNPAVWWMGLAAIIATVVTAFYRKEKGMFVILAGMLSLYLPWAFASRKLIFIYHFFAAVPFMILCISYIFMMLIKRFSPLKYAVYFYLIVVLSLFIMFYPILSGTVVSKSYVATYLRWFQSWIFFR